MHDLSDAAWRTSSRSNVSNACVEVADLAGGHRAVRDSKNPTGSVLRVTAAQWTAFITGLRASEVD